MSVLQERIDAVFDFLDESAKKKIEILQAGVTVNRKKYEKNYAASALRAWKAAEQELEDLVEQLEDAQEGDSCKMFSSIPKVHQFLVGEGWKISRAQLYNHHKLGYLAADKKGRYREDDVNLYAEKFLNRLDGAAGVNLDEAAVSKQEADTRRAVAQAKHWELRTKVDSKAYVPRDLFERELAARALVFKSDLLVFCRSQAAEIIARVNGDATMAPELIDYLVGQVEVFLDRYARDPQGAFKE